MTVCHQLTSPGTAQQLTQIPQALQSKLSSRILVAGEVLSSGLVLQRVVSLCAVSVILDKDLPDRSRSSHKSLLGPASSFSDFLMHPLRWLWIA